MIKDIVIRSIGMKQFRATVRLSDELRFAHGVSGGGTDEGPWISADAEGPFAALSAALQKLGELVCYLPERTS